MTPTPELTKRLLEELSIHHDLHKLCINWDIEDVNNYNLFSSPSQTPVPETNLQGHGTHSPPQRTHHRFPTFG